MWTLEDHPGRGRAKEICTEVAARESARWKHIDHGFGESVTSSLLILMRGSIHIVDVQVVA